MTASNASQRANIEEGKLRLDRLWEGDVDRILFMVLTGDKEFVEYTIDFSALADCVGPQAVVFAQSGARVDFENRSWPGSHILSCKMRFDLENSCNNLA